MSVRATEGLLTLLAVLGAPCCLGATGTAPADSAASQLQLIRSELRDSHARGDWRANLVAAQRQLELLNGAPRSRLELARAAFNVGDRERGMRELARFAAMGQWFDLSGLLPAPADSERPPLLDLQRLIDANRQPIDRGATALSLTDAGVLAEDIDYDPRSGRFYITSVRQKRVIAVDAAGKVSSFVAAPDPWPLVALKVDSAHRLLWVTEVAMDGLVLAPRSDWGRSALLCYDLDSGALLRRIDGPRPSGLGDMVLFAEDVIVSDGDGGGVYRLRKGARALERLDHGEFISPQTPAIAADGRSFIIPDYLRGLAVLDSGAGTVRWLSTEDRFALTGIDGLYRSGNRLLAVQNGTSPERIALFTLDRSFDHIVSEAIIERSPTLDPTHGVLVGDSFYYITRAGWADVDETGQLKRDASPAVARIRRVSLESTR
jgi:hypothetical protein